MGFLTDWLTDWLKELLIEGIMGNLTGLFDTVNSRVGEIAVQVGTTPAAWNAGVFSLIRQLSETVILPIAGLILTFVATYELIQLIIEKNNLHDLDYWIFFKWIFKTACAILILSNTFNIVMAVFDVSQSVIARAAGIVQGSTDISEAMLADLEATLETLGLGSLLGLWLQSLLIHVTMWAINIVIFVIVYGRMIEIYLLTSLAPIPVATLSNRELGSTGQNYLKSLFAVGFQGLLILVCVAIYAVLIQGIATSGDPIGAIWGCKSFAAKRELINVFLATNDRIIVVDPMGEYAPLVRRLGGQVIEIAPDSPYHISPMDLQMNINDEDSPLSMKADFLLSLCELIVGGKEGLQPIEKTVIDRCVRLVYREMALGLETAKTPLLQDLYEELLCQPEPEARRVATALELYCTGSLNLFNHPTNVDLNSRVVCIVLKGLGENLRKIAMHTTNEFVTAAVNANHAEGVATWCYFDEFHILLRDPLTASYFVAVWKMLRKKGCVPSALTQNVKDLLASREIENILDNTDFMVLLSQAQSDRAILAKQLGISEHQLSYITHSNSGEGLLFYGSLQLLSSFPFWCCPTIPSEAKKSNSRHGRRTAVWHSWRRLWALPPIRWRMPAPPPCCKSSTSFARW